MTKHRITRPRRGTPRADHIGPRLRHRARGNALLRHGTSIAIVGGVVLTAGFGIMAYRTTSAQDAARAAAKARLLAYQRHQYELQQAALARLHAQQAAAAAAARYAALRVAQAQERARQQAAATSAAASAAASTPVASSAGAPAVSSGSSSAASAGSSSASTPTPAPTATPAASASVPVVASGGS